MPSSTNSLYLHLGKKQKITHSTISGVTGVGEKSKKMKETGYKNALPKYLRSGLGGGRPTLNSAVTLSSVLRSLFVVCCVLVLNKIVWFNDDDMSEKIRKFAELDLQLWYHWIALQNEYTNNIIHLKTVFS